MNVPDNRLPGSPVRSGDKVYIVRIRYVGCASCTLDCKGATHCPPPEYWIEEKTIDFVPEVVELLRDGRVELKSNCFLTEEEAKKYLEEQNKNKKGIEKDDWKNYVL